MISTAVCSRSTRCLLSAIVLGTLLLSLGCVSTKSMPFETFAKVDRGETKLPPECGQAARREMEDLAASQVMASERIVRFWEKIVKDYEAHLLEAPTVIERDAQIQKLVDTYADYPEKETLLAEIMGYSWPYGLKGYDKAMNLPGPASAAPSDLEQNVLAKRAWPLWVWGRRIPTAQFPANYAHISPTWHTTYAAHREDIHRFWLSVNMVILRQIEYSRNRMVDRGEPVNPDARGATPLPILDGQENRLFALMGVLGRSPAFMWDYKRYEPLAIGGNACRLPCSEAYGLSNAWTSILYSQAKGLQWVATGNFRPGEPKVGNMALYRQEGVGWFLFPMIGYGWGDVTRYPLTSEGINAGAPVKEGGGFSLWPLFIWGKGKGMSPNGSTVRGNTWGIPIAYAQANIKDDKGMAINVREALHFLAYFSVNIQDNQRSYAADTVGLGLLWMSTYDGKTGNSVNGPLWGAFGWGRNNGREIIRIFGFPFERK